MDRIIQIKPLQWEYDEDLNAFWASGVFADYEVTTEGNLTIKVEDGETTQQSTTDLKKGQRQAYLHHAKLMLAHLTKKDKKDDD